jgi:hypothetical protein
MTRRTRDTDWGKKLLRRLRRGSMPQNARAGGVKFEEGHAKQGGRKKGVPNVLSGDVKTAIIEGGIGSGYNTKGKGGLTGLMKRMADQELRTYSTMVRAVMPMQINTNIRHVKPYMTEAEVLAELKARGLPRQTMFQLRYHDVPAKDVDLYGDGGEILELKPLKPPADQE